MKSWKGLYSASLSVINWAALSCLVVFSSCNNVDKNHKISEELGKVVDSIKLAFVPDRRVQIFDYHIPSDGTYIKGRSSNPEAYQQVLGIATRFPGLNLDSFKLVTPLDTALINVSVGNMRSNPSHSAELATQVLMGQQVTVWDKDGYWYYVQAPDKYLAWIDGGALEILDHEQLMNYHHAEKVMYKNDFGFCYETPDEKGAVVSDLVAGDILRKTRIKSTYTEVSLPGGRKGFVPTESIEPLSDLVLTSSPDWPAIKNTAYKFMGRPYLWGGTSGKGVDCSGFTKMVYYLNGLELPRDASQQVNSGIEIPLDENLSQLKPGDFLFFGTKGENGKKDRVTHVGIYIGDGRMIHSSERVQIQSLIPGEPDYAPNRRKTLLSAKRMIDDDTLAQGVEFIKNNPGYGF